MNASLEDVILLADSERSMFDDVHVITTKGHFLDLILHEIPHDLLLTMDGPSIERCVLNLINTRNVMVTQFVDFNTTPVTVCIEAEVLDDDTIREAAMCLVHMIDKVQEDKQGIHTFGNPIKYTLTDVKHLLNWYQPV